MIKGSTTTNEEDEEFSLPEYNEAVDELQKEFKKGRRGWNRKLIIDLLDKTRQRRLKWIKQEKPLVSAIIKKFPALESSKVVSCKCNVVIMQPYSLSDLLLFFFNNKLSMSMTFQYAPNVHKFSHKKNVN